MTAVLAVELISFASMAWKRGLYFAWHRFLETALTPVGILVPIGVGALWVAALVLCAPGMLGKRKKTRSQRMVRAEKGVSDIFLKSLWRNKVLRPLFRITVMDYAKYQSQWGLVNADNVVSQNGQWMFVPAVAGAGTAVAVAAAPATLAWGQEAWAAYQAATQGYSLGAGISAGAIASGVTYTLGAASGAGLDRYNNGTDFSTAFDQRFSPYGLIGTMAVGAMGGAYQTTMFQVAGVVNTWKNFFTVEGAVIRGNQMLISTPLKKAVQAITQDPMVTRPETPKQNDTK